jgi:rhomboid family GlyGly-CTERM serine protease
MPLKVPALRRSLLIAGVVTVALFLPQILLTDWTESLRYDRSAMRQGEWWRLLSAHAVHLDLRHASLNALAAGLMVLLFAGTLRGWHWFLTVLLAALSIDAGLWYLNPAVEWYVGASGVLHGVLAAGSVQWLRPGDRRGWLALLLLGLKLGYEQWGSGALPIMNGALVITAAHLYGAIAGALASAMAPWLLRKPLANTGTHTGR